MRAWRATPAAIKTDMNNWLVSGGFAVVQPNSELSINAVEAYPLEDFSAEVSFVDPMPPEWG